MTQRDPGLAAKWTQPVNCTSSASIKHGHAFGSSFFPLFTFSIPSGKNSLEQWKNVTCLTKADSVFCTRGNGYREQKSNFLGTGHNYDLKLNCPQTKKKQEVKFRLTKTVAALSSRFTFWGHISTPGCLSFEIAPRAETNLHSHLPQHPPKPLNTLQRSTQRT